jgi:hypothetical protein
MLPALPRVGALARGDCRHGRRDPQRTGEGTAPNETINARPTRMNVIRDLACWLFFTALLVIASIVAVILAVVDLVVNGDARD